MFSKVPLFSGLTESEREKLEMGSHTFNYPRGTMILAHGDISTSLYVVLSGRLKIFLDNEDGQEIIINFLEQNEAFGELSLLDDEPRSASVAAVENTTLAVLPRAFFISCLHDNPDMAITLLHTLAQRTRGLVHKIGDLALLDVYGRVANALLTQAKPDAQGRKTTPVLTHQELANMTGASREMVTRILNDLKRGGYISIENRQIILHNSLPSRW